MEMKANGTQAGCPREEALALLVARAQSCKACPRMEHRVRVLGPANGRIGATVLFVAEAPGRLGADRCGIPLHGDQTGRNFESLLAAARIERNTVFITNAILCNPRDVRGRNAPPSTAEIRNCSAHLRDTIAIVQPRYVVTLGRVALDSLRLIEAHAATLAHDVGRLIAWNGRWLIPLYHPGSRARIHRSLLLQAEDYRQLGRLLQMCEGTSATDIAYS